jgi:transcriptional regulator with XRE-family HTH domain
MTFRETLNWLRAKKGLSIARLATAAGLPLSTVNSYVISGKHSQMPSLHNAAKLAQALGVSLAAFDRCIEWASVEPVSQATDPESVS